MPTSQRKSSLTELGVLLKLIGTSAGYITRTGWWGDNSQVEDTCVVTAVASVDQENGASRGNSRRTSSSPSAGFSGEVRDWALRPNP